MHLTRRPRLYFTLLLPLSRVSTVKSDTHTHTHTHNLAHTERHGGHDIWQLANAQK